MIVYFLFNLSYLFSVLLLGLLVGIFMLFNFCDFLYLKYLIVLIYLSGVVVFILYISCMCWYTKNKMSWCVLSFSVLVFNVFDLGGFLKISDVGEYMWMFLFFSFLFANLVNLYSLNLFKVAGSLRF